MSKPASVPTFATDTDYSGGGEAGTAVKATPTSGQRAQGFQESVGVNALYLNYLLNAIGSWLTWLDGILAEALTWTGAQTFSPSAATTAGITATGNTSGPGAALTGGASGHGAVLTGGTKAALALTSQTVSSHADGTVWYDGTDLKCRLGGATKTITVA
jgi:hypothetical protein